MKETVTHPAIGEITLSRTRRSTRISLSVRPDGEVRLCYPFGVTQRRAMKFLEEKLDWITAAREKLAVKYPSAPITSYSTRMHTLRLVPKATDRPSFAIRAGEIIVSFPETSEPESDGVQSVVEKGITEALRAEAKQILPEMVERLAAEHGFRYGTVSIRASRSKWGSCTARDDINLSLFLATLPDDLAEYVVLHELCHTVHKNHSPEFHGLLDRVTGGRSRELNRRLKSHRPDIRNNKNL